MNQEDQLHPKSSPEILEKDLKIPINLLLPSPSPQPISIIIQMVQMFVVSLEKPSNLISEAFNFPMSQQFV